MANENFGFDIDANISNLDGKDMFTAIKWVAEQIPGGFFIYRADESQEMLYVNREHLRIFGCETLEEYKELTGYTFRGMVHPDDFDSIQKSIDDQIAVDANKENLDYVVYRIIRKDGSVRWVDDYGHFASLPGYGDVYYVFIGDITEKYLAGEENKRRANIYESMLSRFSSFADDSLCMIRANLTSGIIEEVKGNDLYESDRVGEKTIDIFTSRKKDFLSDADRDKFDTVFNKDNLLKRYYEGKEPASLVLYCKRKSVRQCFVKYTGSVVVDPSSGDIYGFYSETEYNAEKVTDVLNNHVLAKQYDMVCYIVGDYYGVVIGDAADIKKGSIFPKERDGIYMDYISSQVLPVADRSVHDIDKLKKALSPVSIISELEEKDVYSVDVACVIGGDPYNKRFTFYAVDREALFYMLLKSDITDVVLEQRQRSELLANALKEAEKANAAKTTFLSNMSHEIRTPMDAILGIDSLALKDPDISERTRTQLEKIGESARHLLDLLNDILDMSRIESGKMALSRDDFSFRNMLEQINTMIQAQCDEKDLTYECSVAGNISDYYYGDDTKLKQVLLNILGNAVKFTPAKGHVSFMVDHEKEADNRSWIRFTISDDGIGMEESYISRLFDAFTQEDESSSGSTGLGMAISKNLVDMMDGEISVESKKGVGSTFTVRVPLSHSRLNDAHIDELDTESLKVLIIDDDQTACEHAQLVLEDAGITADYCHSGKSAFNMMDEAISLSDPYNLVLVDWKMPEMNGIEVTRRIRNLYRDDSLMILITTYNWDDIIEEAIDAGADGFVAKPLFASAVIEQYRNLSARMEKRDYDPDKDYDISGKRVLLAEDMAVNAEIITQLLTIKDLKVDRAENGQVAVQIFGDSPVRYYDAILMDIRMPVKNGLDAAKEIRAMDREDAADIPIIALTANAFDEDVKASFEAGMDTHLSKPIEPESLYDALGKYIGE